MNAINYGQGIVKNGQSKKKAAEVVLIVVFIIEIIFAIIGFNQAGSCKDEIVCGELLINIGIAATVFLIGVVIAIALYVSYRHDR